LSIQLFEFIGTYFYTHSWSAVVAKTDLRMQDKKNDFPIILLS